MKSGNGKIANLPNAIRDELNYRLNDGESGTELIEWLNAKPEVRKVLEDRFDGRPISEQNLSQWRTHGYRQWHAFHITVDESYALSDDSEVLAESGVNCEKLLLTLTAAYAEMSRRWIITPVDEMKYKLAVFKTLTQQALALRNAELQKARLEIQRGRLELLLEKQRHKSASSTSSAPSSSNEVSLPSPVSEGATTAKTVHESSEAAAKPHPPSPTPATSNPPTGNRNEEPARKESAATPHGNPPIPPTPVAPPAPKSNPHPYLTAPPRNATPRNPRGLL